MQEVNEKAERNNAVDFLQFLFCMAIVCHHSYMLMYPSVFPCYFQGAWIFTDFFFFLSGILMIGSAEKVPIDSRKHVWRETGKFILHKFGRIYPYFLTAFFLHFGIVRYFESKSLMECFSDLADSIWTLLMVYMLGFNDCGTLGVSWYLSAMLIAMAFLFPLLLVNERLYLHTLAPVIVVAAYVLLDMHSGGQGLGGGSPREYIGFAMTGTVRAFGGLCAGALLRSAAKYMAEFRNSPGYVRIFYTMLELCGYGYVICRSAKEIVGKDSYVCLLILAVSLTLTVSGVTYSGGFLPDAVCRYLGRLSLSVYLCQQAAIALVFWLPVKTNRIPLDYPVMFLVYIPAALAIGAVVDKLIDLAGRNLKWG